MRFKRIRLFEALKNNVAYSDSFFAKHLKKKKKILYMTKL